MAYTTKLKHVDQLKNGVLRFRRRFPKEVAAYTGQGWLQVHIRNTAGLKLYTEYQAVLDHFDKIVSSVRCQLAREGHDNRTYQQKWHDALMEAAGLKAGISGQDPDAPETAQSLPYMVKGRPLSVDDRLLGKCNTTQTAPTVRDAANLYEKDKQMDREDVVRLDRTLRRFEGAIGRLDQMPLHGLKREHGRKLVDHMLSLKKRDGSALALSSVQREVTIIAALVTHGLREMDIDVRNPFNNLSWPKKSTLAVEKKLPLPDDLTMKIEARLQSGKTAELSLIWRLLKGTGCRVNEIAGLEKEDIVLDAGVPHLLIRPNLVRGLKTVSSHRSVPLTGEALIAAEKAAEGVQAQLPVFARYARHRGADSLSATLAKALRVETKDKRYSTHGLRHRVSDKLREASVDFIGLLPLRSRLLENGQTPAEMPKPNVRTATPLRVTNLNATNVSRRAAGKQPVFPNAAGVIETDVRVADQAESRLRCAKKVTEDHCIDLHSPSI